MLLTIIGIVKCAIELGAFDIITDVSFLFSHLALPRAGHLEAAIHKWLTWVRSATQN